MLSIGQRLRKIIVDMDGKNALDERREVAARLREQVRYMRENNCYEEDLNAVDCGNSAYRSIAWSVEPYGNFEKGNYVHILERLADLIDPD